MAGEVKKKKTFKDSMTNPLINQVRKKMDKLTETSDEYMTYAGVAKKTAFFLIMAFAGAIVAGILNARLPKNIVKDGVPAVNSTVVLISVVCAFLGMLISILAGTPVGSTIVAVDVAAFGVSYAAGMIMGCKA